MTGICPAPADLAISKLAAWREKDQEFVRVLVKRGLVTVDELEAHVAELEDRWVALVRPRLRALGVPAG